MRKVDFCEQVKTYQYQLYVIAYTILKNEEDAQDAVCSAILKGYEHLDQLKNPRKFKSWMIAITKNEALQIKRKRVELPGNEMVEELIGGINDKYDDNELWDIVQTLKEEFRLVIVLFYYNDLSMWEIAEVLDIPLGTVKSRLNRGRKILKMALEERRKDHDGI